MSLMTALCRAWSVRCRRTMREPPQCTTLIKDGVLAGHLHSLETAGKMKARPTGNARTMNASHTPIVRMTNTYIKPGSLSKGELLPGCRMASMPAECMAARR